MRYAAEWTAGVRLPAWRIALSLLQTASGANPTSYLMDTCDNSLPRSKVEGGRVKNGGIITSTLPYFLLYWCLSDYVQG